MLNNLTKPYCSVSFLAIQDFIYSLKNNKTAHEELLNECMYRLTCNWYKESGHQCKN